MFQHILDHTEIGVNDPTLTQGPLVRENVCGNLSSAVAHK